MSTVFSDGKDGWMIICPCCNTKHYFHHLKDARDAAVNVLEICDCSAWEQTAEARFIQAGIDARERLKASKVKQT